MCGGKVRVIRSTAAQLKKIYQFKMSCFQGSYSRSGNKKS